jgi:hypothetical protein
MPDRNRDPRNSADYRDSRNNRGARDYRDLDRDPYGRSADQFGGPSRIYEKSYGRDVPDGGAYDPREPHIPAWMRDENPRQGFGGMREQESTARGRFYGRGPKGYRRSDDRILEEVSDRLMTHPDVDASDIEVRVAGGVVTLAGTVEDRHEKHLAEYIAEDAIGVDDVDNQLKVRHGFWATLTGEKASERQIERHAEREGIVSKEETRTAAARNAVRRDPTSR